MPCCKSVFKPTFIEPSILIVVVGSGRDVKIGILVARKGNYLPNFG